MTGDDLPEFVYRHDPSSGAFHPHLVIGTDAHGNLQVRRRAGTNPIVRKRTPIWLVPLADLRANGRATAAGYVWVLTPAMPAPKPPPPPKPEPPALRIPCVSRAETAQTGDGRIA